MEKHIGEDIAEAFAKAGLPADGPSGMVPKQKVPPKKEAPKYTVKKQKKSTAGPVTNSKPRQDDTAKGR